MLHRSRRMTAATIMAGVIHPARGTYALPNEKSLDRHNIVERLTLSHSKIQESRSITKDICGEEIEPTLELSNLLSQDDSSQGQSSISAHNGYSLGSVPSPSIHENQGYATSYGSQQFSPESLPLQSLDRCTALGKSSERNGLSQGSTGHFIESFSQISQAKYPPIYSEFQAASIVNNEGREVAQNPPSNKRPNIRTHSFHPSTRLSQVPTTLLHQVIASGHPRFRPLAVNPFSKARSPTPPPKKVRGRKASPNYKSLLANGFNEESIYGKKHSVLPIAPSQYAFGVLGPVKVQKKDRAVPQGVGKTTRKYRHHTAQISKAPRAKNCSHYHRDSAVPTIERDDPINEELFGIRVADPMDVVQDIMQTNRVASQIDSSNDNSWGYVNAERSMMRDSIPLNQQSIHPTTLTSPDKHYTSASPDFQNFFSNQTQPAANLSEHYTLNSALHSPGLKTSLNPGREATLNSTNLQKPLTNSNINSYILSMPLDTSQSQVAHHRQSETEEHGRHKMTTEHVLQAIEVPTSAGEEVESREPDRASKVNGYSAISSPQPEQQAEAEAGDDGNGGGYGSLLTYFRDSSPIESQPTPAGDADTNSFATQAIEEDAFDIMFADLLPATCIPSHDDIDYLSADDDAINQEFALLLPDASNQSPNLEAASNNAIDDEFSLLLPDFSSQSPNPEAASKDTIPESSHLPVNPSSGSLNPEGPSFDTAEYGAIDHQLTPSLSSSSSPPPIDGRDRSSKARSKRDAKQTPTQTKSNRLPVPTSQKWKPTKRPLSVANIAAHDATLRMNHTSDYFIGHGREYPWLKVVKGEVYNPIPKLASSKRKASNGSAGSSKVQQSTQGAERSSIEVQEREVINLDSDDEGGTVVAEESSKHQTNMSKPTLSKRKRSAESVTSGPSKVQKSTQGGFTRGNEAITLVSDDEDDATIAEKSANSYQSTNAQQQRAIHRRPDSAAPPSPINQFQSVSAPQPSGLGPAFAYVTPYLQLQSVSAPQPNGLGPAPAYVTPYLQRPLNSNYYRHNRQLDYAQQRPGPVQVPYLRSTPTSDFYHNNEHLEFCPEQSPSATYVQNELNPASGHGRNGAIPFENPGVPTSSYSQALASNVQAPVDARSQDEQDIANSSWMADSFDIYIANSYMIS